jgi:hypothetical protein
MADRNHLERMHDELADSGKLIEAGWVGMRLACDLVNAPADQLREMRMAFFAGAQHLFGSIMTVLEPGDEPTATDLRRLDLIDKELKAFIADFSAKHIPTKGNA